MNREDIIRMAKEAGGIQTEPKVQPYFWRMHNGDLERFAALVAAAEREACAELIESRKTGANELMDAVRSMEAYAIRARGETK